jgi:hypothetical protein
VQWAKLLHHEGFPLTLLSNMPLELSRHVTKSFPSRRIGNNPCADLPDPRYEAVNPINITTSRSLPRK